MEHFSLIPCTLAACQTSTTIGVGTIAADPSRVACALARALDLVNTWDPIGVMADPDLAA